MRFAIIVVLLTGALALTSASRGTEPLRTGTTRSTQADDATGIPARMVEEGIRQLKSDGVAGLCAVAFAEGKSIHNPSERATATGHFQRLRDAMTVRYGKSSGEFELIRTEVIGTSIVKFTYLEKLEKTPVVWKFVFYRVAGEWKWKDLGVNDNLEPEFRSADGSR